MADSANHTIRRVRGNVVSVFAGHVGLPGHFDSMGKTAQFNFPMGVSCGERDGADMIWVGL